MWRKDLMRSWFEIKVQALVGPDEGGDKEVVILGRLVRWVEDRIGYEADPNHMEKGFEYLGMNGGTGVEPPWGTDCKEEERDQEEFEKEKAKVYGGLAVSLKFLKLDCPDLQFPTKPRSRGIAKPVMGSWRR